MVKAKKCIYTNFLQLYFGTFQTFTNLRYGLHATIEHQILLIWFISLSYLQTAICYIMPQTQPLYICIKM